MITSQNAKQSENMTVGNHKFEVVQTCIFPGSPVSCNNDGSQEIKIRILIATRNRVVESPCNKSEGRGFNSR
jgi:hypothetical protein